MLTAEQLEARRHRIGASDVAKICGLSKWGTPFDVWAEKVHGVFKPAGEAAGIGSRMEPVILDWAEKDYGLHFLHRTGEVNRPGLDFPLVVTLDALSIGPTGPVNAKTAGLKGAPTDDWGEAETDEIPEEYRIQEQMELLATGADVAFVPALIVPRGFVMFRVTRNDEMIGYLKDICAKFWRDHVMTGVPPEVGERAPDEYVLRHLRREPQSVIELPSEALWLADKWEEEKTVAKEAQSAAEDAGRRLVAMLGTAEVGRLPDGRLFTYLEARREMPAKEAHTQIYRTLRIKKGNE